MDETCRNNSIMRLTRRQLRQLIREAATSPEFSVIKTPSGNDGLRIYTPQDNATRDVIVISMPDGSAQAYYQSSGVSGGGYKGKWAPFEGWSTASRVLPGKSYGDFDPDENIQLFFRDATYGDTAIMAKTYWGTGTAIAPEGTIHADGAAWLNGWLRDNDPVFKDMTIADHAKQLGMLNRWLWRNKAIDRARSVFRVSTTGRGRRIQFGLDQTS